MFFSPRTEVVDIFKHVSAQTSDFLFDVDFKSAPTNQNTSSGRYNTSEDWQKYTENPIIIIK